MKVLIDMNLTPRWVGLLQAASIDAVHWTQVGAANAADSAIMAWAREHQCIVLTNDLDFSTILAASQGLGPSVVQLRADDVSPEAVGPRVIAALLQLKDELQDGMLVTIDTLRLRLRTLPLHLSPKP